MHSQSKICSNLNHFINKKRSRRLTSDKLNELYSLSSSQKKINKKEIKVKNSKKLNNPKLAIDYCKTVYASDEDFKNPIAFFENLWRTNKKSTGIIKIIPPASWKEINSQIFDKIYLPNFTRNQNKLETRIQNLNLLKKGKKFDFIKKFNFKEYKENAELIYKQFYSYPGTTNEMKEEDYWRFCNNIDRNELKVHYAADLSHKLFLNNNDVKKINEILNSNNSWNLSTIFGLKDSFFQFLKNKSTNHISGLTMPWLYFGMIFSTFCWHVEDLYMYSINYMYNGSSKIWYSIPHNQKEKLDYYIKNNPSIEIKDLNSLQKLILLADPRDLIENGIKVYKGVQNPGEIIFTLPKAYHCGFSTGFNISEAVNLASYKWIKYGIEACQDYSIELTKTPVISIQWLLDNFFYYLSNYEYTNKKNILDVITVFNNNLLTELTKRKKLENYFNKKKIFYKHSSIKENQVYTKTECALCTNYGYFSYIKCSICNIRTCIDHLKICHCPVPILMLYYRYIDNTIEKIKKIFSDQKKI